MGTSNHRPLARRHSVLLFLLVLGLALVMRLIALDSLQDSVYGAQLLPDEDLFHQLATRLASGESAPLVADFPTLPAHVFAVGYRLFGSTPLSTRGLNVALGVILCGLTFVCARRLFDARAGLLAALLCAISQSLSYYSVSAHKTMLGLCFTMTLVVLLIELWKGRERMLVPMALLLGLCLLAVFHVRANAVLLGLLSPVMLRWREPRLPPARIAMLLGLIVAGGLGGALLSGASGGPRGSWDLYIGNHKANDSPYPAPVRFASSMPSRLSVGFVIEAARQQGRPLNEQEAAAHFRQLTYQELSGAPGWAVQHAAQKLLALAHSSTRDANQDVSFLTQVLPGLRLSPLPSWLLIALGLAGLFGLQRSPEQRFGVLLIGAYALGPLAFFVDERLRAPLLPVAACFAAGGLLHVRETRQPIAPALTLLVTAALAHAPLAGARDRSRAFNMHATILLDAGRTQEASEYYHRSVEAGTESSSGGHLGLAAIAHAAGNLKSAQQHLLAVQDTYVEAASKWEWLGVLALDRHDYKAADDAFAHATDIDGSRLNAYKGRYIAQRKLGDPVGAQLTQAQIREVTRYYRELTGAP